MLQHQIEELMMLVAAMDRPTLTEQCLQFQGRFPVDFTPEFLSSLSLDRLRHIFFALCLQNDRLPAEPLAA